MQAYHSRNRLKPMGMYINKGNNDFRDIVAHEYVDKTSLIPLINAMLNSENRYSCVTRCRRFGKSMAAKIYVPTTTGRATHGNCFGDWKRKGTHRSELI